MEKDKDALYIPVNIRRRKEWADGFGKPELIKTVTWFFIGIIIGSILYFVKERQITYIVFSAIFFSGSAFALTKKDKTNRSSLDHLRDLYKFYVDEKRYDYKYHNIYEKEGRKKK